MRSIRVGILVTVIAVAALTGTPPLRAAAPGETVPGDYNGDGLTDLAALGAVSPNLCSTIVQYGSAPGIYLPPVAYTYLAVGRDPIPNCPDIGVATDLNLDGLDDLGVGWSQGPPTGLGFNRLILIPPTFQPLFTYTSALNRPIFLGAAVFSPGSRPTPYAVGPGGMVNSVFNGSTLVPGPIRFCSVDAPSVQLADWNQDQVEGVLLSYRNACTDGSSGVVRIHQDGSTVPLEHDPTGQAVWTARAFNANDDRFPDVRTIKQPGGEVSYFINTGLGDQFFLVRAPHANTDRIRLAQVKPQAIDVIANDYASRYAEVTITRPPRYGTVTVLSDRRILYRPSPTHGRTDQFTYQLLEENRRSSANVTVQFPS